MLISPILDLSGKGLEHIDEIFRSLLMPQKSKITTLILTKNKISRLFQSFEDVLTGKWVAVQMESLDMRDNNLEDVPYTI
jgi:Leucine-rich repeat (LRR) protein